MTSVLTIALSGLNSAVLRVANAASNIVNASSTGRLPANAGETSNAFAPQDVVSTSDTRDGHPFGVTSHLQPRDPAYVTAFDPTSPNANAQGLIAAPNVDLNAELIASKIAEVSYSASVAVVKTASKMEKALLDIKT